MKQLQFVNSDGTLVINPKKILIALLPAAILAVFLNSNLSIVLGPFMALAFTYLYFFGYQELVTAIILVGNDALGTMIMGSLSFPYLLLCLVIIRFLMTKKFRFAGVAYFAVAVVLVLQPYATESLNLRGAIYSFTFISSLLILPKEEESWQRLFRGIALTVVLIGLHACITGGVEYYELNEYSEEVLRKGILGIGVGDSNFSCYLILVGMTCVWYEKTLGIFWKIVCTGILLYAIMITLSTTGLLGLIMIGLLAALLGKKKGKSLTIILIIALIVVCLFQWYTQLPAGMRDATLDGYIARVEEKIFQAQQGDFEAATTKRSYLAEAYIKYILNQPLLPLLFGGNKVVLINNLIAHNTYLTLILQVGLLGAGAILVWMIWKLARLYLFPKGTENRSVVLILKILSLFFAFALSFYDGSLWALWFYFLLVL